MWIRLTFVKYRISQLKQRFPRGVSLCGAVRGGGTEGCRTTVLLLVRATVCSMTAHRLRISGISRSVWWASAMCEFSRDGQYNSPFGTRSFACASITFLVGILSWSVNSIYSSKRQWIWNGTRSPQPGIYQQIYLFRANTQNLIFFAFPIHENAYI